ncbi:other hect domain ubiquitin protein ligase E3 [Trypanosoma rangeli]|uniref:Other hect domain ubiquitin protein ligase E3 n=1 Tax=Trypanosoma rangeli TaxID=5698 RepID=A0A3R7KJ27_TRYRA|nr:other hect domain ubiquitin protein ligase E3 [Trypanosoma rangeli]RNF08564.1 other hect domain ubiquitin protein ligase E3 [Trypanosoma rangeli]|eukprot:RNF08564.1 other hect domain ubiquitin protein ligase E3 [Trypanosoma rangeli]
MLFEFDCELKKPPYENLSDLCTILVIAEERNSFPVQRVFAAINTALRKAGEDGNVVVLAVRALALILDKFSRKLSLPGEAGISKEVEECFKTVFSFVKDYPIRLQYTKTTENELKEELLTCLSMAGNCEAVAAVVPSTEEQLKFCFSALDGSKWTACKVLHHCTGLMRSGVVQNAGDHELLVQLLQLHLGFLSQLPIDYEWEELLRTVVEGIITYRAWCVSQLPLRRKRARASAAYDNAAKTAGNSFEEASLKNATEALLAIGERVFSSAVSPSIIELTIACVASVAEASSPYSEANEKAIGWVTRLLQQTAAPSAEYSSPFDDDSPSVATGDRLWADASQSLPNLQWVVPPLTWSALVLLSKLCGAVFGIRGDHMWAFRSVDGEYFPYRSDDREQLTAMFFAAGKNKNGLEERHRFDLRSMTDKRSFSSSPRRMHFQPVPSAFLFDGKLSVPPASIHIKSETSALIQAALLPFTLGHSKTAFLARAIRLYVICGRAPTTSEDVVVVFRSLSSEQKPHVVEEISSALLQRDKGWAPVLLEAGVADALTALPASTTAKQIAVNTSTTQNRLPVAELIRSAGSSPKAAPMQLPPLAELPAFLLHASPSELLAFIEALETSSLSMQELEKLCAELAMDSRVEFWMRDAAYNYMLRLLHNAGVGQRQKKDLRDVLFHNSYSVGICTPARGEKGRLFCPKGHLLCVHFSVNWSCNKCKKTSSFGSLACRECDYDICMGCINKKLSRVEVNVSANAGDILRYWRDCQTKKGSGEASLQMELKHSVLFTSKGVLPATVPASTLKEEEIHFAKIGTSCKCNITVPLLTANFMERAVLDSPLQVLLRAFGAPPQWGDVESAIVDVLESFGGDIFEKGILGIPARVAQLLEVASPYLSTSFKRDTAHFLAVGCCRFALFHLQGLGAVSRGSVSGEITSNGLPTKFTVSRETKVMTRVLFDAFLQYPSIRNKVEFNFKGEEGTGEGPTQELYTELAQRYRDMTNLWHERDDGTHEAFPTLRQVHAEEFFVLGASCARAFVDDYVINMDLLPLAWPFIRSGSVSLETKWATLAELEPTLVNTYTCMMRSTDAELEEMGLEDESGVVLTAATVKAYVERRVEEHLVHATLNFRWFALGISTVFDLRALWFVSDNDMSVVLSGVSREGVEGRLFGEEALRSAIVEAHGYSVGSREVAMMVSLVGGEFTREQQQFFLEFLTGSPRLPLNGLAGLGRKITVVRKELEGTSEQTLPSCNTCFLYFKLPPYTSRAIMKARLLTAITEGRKNFSLS